jgi:hypothetical protein
VHADGLGRVVKVAANGRVCAAKVTESLELLETLGYPELMPDVE